MADITKLVAKGRFAFHTNMLDIYNVLNQLHIISDEKAERKMGYHTIEALESDSRLKGYSSFDAYLRALEAKKTK